MHLVAVGIPLAVLDVADEGVGPVAEPERPVGTDLGIDRPEVLVGALEEVERGRRISRIVPDADALVAGPVVGDRPAGDAVHLDQARVDELALNLFGELPGPQVFAPHHRTHLLGVEDRIHPLSTGILGPRQRRVPMLRSHGAVTDDALAPFVEYVAPRVAVARRLEVADLPGAGIDHVATRRPEIAKRSPGRLERRAQAGPLERVEQPAVAHFERTRRMVRVIRAPAVEHVNHGVGPVVSVGVSEPEETRLIDDEHAAGKKLKPGRAVEPIVEDRPLVGPFVAIGVFEDHELVGGRRITRPPLRIARHRRHPQPALRVECQLHRLGDFRKGPLVGEETDLEAGGHGAGLDERLRRKDLRPAFLVFHVHESRVPESRWRCDQFPRVGVVHHVGDGHARRELPDAAVADRRHVAELHVLAGKCLRVPRAIAAIRIPAVDHPVVLQVHPGFVVHRRLEPREDLHRKQRRRRSPEQRPIERLADEPVARLVHVAAVDRELPSRLGGKGRHCDVEQVDERQPLGGRHVTGSGAVEGEGGVLGDGVGQERIA